MKVKCLIDCNGTGYENFKKGQERELPENIAKKLIEFGYVEAVSKVILASGTVNNLGSIAKALEMPVFSEEHTEFDKLNLIVAEIITLKAELAAEKKENEFLKSAENLTGNLNDENGNDIILPAGDIKTDLENLSEIKPEETEEEKRERLLARAKELGVKGVLTNFQDETLEKKIAEYEAVTE